MASLSSEVSVLSSARNVTAYARDFNPSPSWSPVYTSNRSMLSKLLPAASTMVFSSSAAVTSVDTVKARSCLTGGKVEIGLACTGLPLNVANSAVKSNSKAAEWAGKPNTSLTCG